MSPASAPPARRGPAAKDGVVVVNDPDQRGEGATISALDVRGEHRVLAGLRDEELAEIPLLPEGVGLRRFGVYLDLRDPGRAEFAAEGDETVKPGQRIVARDGVHAPLWDALRRGCLAATGSLRRRSA